MLYFCVCRINWTEPWVPSVHPQKAAAASSIEEAGADGAVDDANESNSAFYAGAEGEGEVIAAEEEDISDSDGDSDSDGNGNGESDGTKYVKQSSARQQQPQQYGTAPVEQQQQQQPLSMEGNRCDLLWQGSLPKRCFTGFKFQQAQSAAAARKLMKAKGVGHYWDMVENADAILASSAAPALF